MKTLSFGRLSILHSDFIYFWALEGIHIFSFRRVIGNANGRHVGESRFQMVNTYKVFKFEKLVDISELTEILVRSCASIHYITRNSAITNGSIKGSFKYTYSR